MPVFILINENIEWEEAKFIKVSKNGVFKLLNNKYEVVLKDYPHRYHWCD